MTIHGVLGPIRPEELGLTSLHEHIFIDARVWFDPPDDPAAPRTVELGSLGWTRRHIHSVADNLVLDDFDTAVAEAKAFAQAGGRTIVDVTPDGLGRRLDQMPQVARQAGINLVASTSLYTHDAHPAWVEAASVDQIANYFLDELDNGVGASGILPALIGEIGTSREITSREWRVLRGAGAAAAQSGCAISVHLDPFPTDALNILEVLVSEGVDPSRVIFSHMDEHLDLAYHREVAQAGAVIEYDTFGAEFYWGDFHRDPTDKERLNHLTALLAEGYANQITLGCDVWIKVTLRRYGGEGYAHLPEVIVPLLRQRYGIDQATLDMMLTGTPARLLDR
ncbi:MAG: hypothetical protein LBJ62_02965 [Bifidobacteriaceae bacterium]|jgi:phosphotriesterase-related protein|nr:hypothetical protein [Bifidobacteriaceae bacterium]